MIKLKTEFITDEKGRKKSVIIPYRQYRALMEDLCDLKIIAEREKESSSSFDDFTKELKKDGLL